MLVHVVASLETSIRYPVAYAASQLSATPLIAAAPPRSTWIRCGSLARLLQRVVVRPSNAAAGALAPSTDDAFTGRNRAMFGALAGGPEVGGADVGGAEVGGGPPAVRTANSH